MIEKRSGSNGLLQLLGAIRRRDPKPVLAGGWAAKNAHCSLTIQFVTVARILRSRMTVACQVRFGSSGGVSDGPADCNLYGSAKLGIT